MKKRHIKILILLKPMFEKGIDRTGTTVGRLLRASGGRLRKQTVR